MYAILYWMMEDEYCTFIHNEDGSVRLFESIREADMYAEKIEPNDSVRVISIEGVRE